MHISVCSGGVYRLNVEPTTLDDITIAFVLNVPYCLSPSWVQTVAAS